MKFKLLGIEWDFTPIAALILIMWSAVPIISLLIIAKSNGNESILFYCIAIALIIAPIATINGIVQKLEGKQK